MVFSFHTTHAHPGISYLRRQIQRQQRGVRLVKRGLQSRIPAWRVRQHVRGGRDGVPNKFQSASQGGCSLKRPIRLEGDVNYSFTSVFGSEIRG